MLVILAHAAVPSDPSEGAFDNPRQTHNLERPLTAFDDAKLTTQLSVLSLEEGKSRVAPEPAVQEQVLGNVFRPRQTSRSAGSCGLIRRKGVWEIRSWRRRWHKFWAKMDRPGSHSESNVVCT